MLQKLRERSQSETGFTLVELLVVMLIIGLLAAIAIPSFFNQRDKARDAGAKEAVRTAQTAMETYATDNGGSYNSRHRLWPTCRPLSRPWRLPVRAVRLRATPPCTAVSGSTANGYTVTVTSKTGNAFCITRNAGTITYTCTVPSGSDRGGCPTGSNWN